MASYEWSQVEDTRGRTLHKLVIYTTDAQSVSCTGGTRFEALHRMWEAVDSVRAHLDGSGDPVVGELIQALNEAESHER